jgi:hypothetical protein
MRSAFGASLSAALLTTTLLVAGENVAAAQRAAKPANPANEKLEKLPPAQRAAVLARVVGQWCIGTETFLMGVVTTGTGQGNAYWSLRCTDGSTWALQVDPLAEVTAIDCDTFKTAGVGKECFKKF